MLEFFRKYQKIFYLIITVVIIVSFSFFGTYSTLQRNTYVDKTAFVAINGEKIGRQKLEELAQFIGTDTEDKLYLGGNWGPNFLNDGVIKKDFIETGLAEIVVHPYLSELSEDLKPRFQKEKRYVPYEHPQAKFLNAVNSWNVVAPDITKELLALQGYGDPTTPEAFATRIKLFQAERLFPHAALRYLLQHQQRQYNWLSPDPNFGHTDLALFGYHTIPDWFGPRFVRLIAETIINSAIIAEQKGYTVSKSEALADLFRNAEQSYQQNVSNPRLGVANVQSYFEEQLRRMGLDQTKAVSLWQKVMLFRRLFNDFGNAVFVDPFTIQQIQNYAKETIEGDLYKLPDELQIGDFRALQKFELYLQAVSERPSEMLKLPSTFKSAAAVSQNYPELVERRYLLEYGKVDRQTLLSKVGVKEAWDWEMEEQNWDILRKEFPELGKGGERQEERLSALDSLDSKTRARVDAFARGRIVDKHPELLSEALQDAEREKRVIGIRKKGENALLPGIKDPKPLIALLDRYPESQQDLAAYTQDGRTYYSITVLGRSPSEEVITFGEATKDGTLSALVEKHLQKEYEALKKRDPKTFQNQDGSWKPLNQVQQKVGELSFNNILAEIKKDQAAHPDGKEKPSEMISDYAATLRLFSFMRDVERQLQKNPELEDKWVRREKEGENENELPERPPLAMQWQIIKKPYKADRGAPLVPIDYEKACLLTPDAWTEVEARANGDIAFLHLHEKYQGEDKLALYEKVMQTQRLLSNDAKKHLMQQLVRDMEAKKALSLKYLMRDESEEE